MSETVSRVELTQSIHTLVGYLDDLARVGFDGAMTKMRLIVNYATRDHTLRPLTELLRTRLSTREFFELVGGDALDMPAAGSRRLAFLYDVLHHLKDGHKINLRELLTSRQDFSGGGIEDRWRTFQARIVHPLRDEMGQLERWFEEHVTDDAVVVADVVRSAFASLYDESRPDAAAAPPAGDTPAGDDPLGAVRAAVRAAGLDAATAADAEVDVDLLAVELRKQRPDPARLAELVDSLRAASAACGEAAAQALPGATPPAPTPAPAAPGPAPAARATAAPPAAPTADGLEPERAALAAEREALTAERRALDAERAALAAERAALAAERRALDARR